MSEPRGVSDPRVRTAEVVAALSLATDLGIGVPLEHGLHSTLIAMRLCRALGVDAATATDTYYACLLFYVGCTATAETAGEIFGEDNALTTYGTPARFGTPRQMVGGMLRAIAPPHRAPPVRAGLLLRGLPRMALEFKAVQAAMCQAAEMLTAGLGLPATVSALFTFESERWDGKGSPSGVGGDEIPLPVRIVHVARDAAFQMLLGGRQFAADVIRRRAGHAFDPTIAAELAGAVDDVLTLGPQSWSQTLACEPLPWSTLHGDAVERALRTMGHFSDLVSPCFLGHADGVAQLAGAAGERSGFTEDRVTALRRAALVHDLGRVAVPSRIWQQAGPLTADDWEQIRLHTYYTDRVLAHSPFLAELAPVATHHHERVDGSGYHRGVSAAALSRDARLLAAADAYRAMREPRAHRRVLGQHEAAQLLAEETRAGRLDGDAVAAVLDAAGQPRPRIERPAGLTAREVDVVRLLARGAQTKQIARALGISTKTADHHVENAYRKMGVSTRAAAALFAMEHGLTA